MKQILPFGNYVLLDRVSVGGTAEIWKAKPADDVRHGRVIAIKRILPSMADDGDFIQTFIDEARLASQLHHPLIAEILEVGRVSGSLFIATEYVWGKDLLQIQNRFRRASETMPFAMAAWCAMKVAEALDYAHRKTGSDGHSLGILHRDVSPQNVLVSYTGDVKVIDFGIAKAAGRATRTQGGVLKGKFGYMSPEQVAGKALDRRADVFSLGTILYELIMADRLFVGDSDFATLEKVRNVDVPPPHLVVPSCPEALEKIILRALARNVADRYQSAAEMQQALAAFLWSLPEPFSPASLSMWMLEQFSVDKRREEESVEELTQAAIEMENAPSPVPSWTPVAGPAAASHPTRITGVPGMYTRGDLPIDPASISPASISPTSMLESSSLRLPSSRFPTISPIAPNGASSPIAATTPGHVTAVHARRSPPQTLGKDIYIGLCVAALIVVAGITARVATQHNSEGALVVYATPGNANVIVDGADRGEAKAGHALVIKKLPSGNHAVHVKGDAGEYDEQVVLVDGDVATVTATLSIPAAKIPAPTIAAAPASDRKGERTGTSERMGKSERTGTSDSTDDSATRKPAHLSVKSDPPGADVNINSKTIGVTPFETGDVEGDNVRVSIHLKGYVSVARYMDFDENPIHTLEVKLVPSPRGDGANDSDKNSDPKTSNNGDNGDNGDSAKSARKEIPADAGFLLANSTPLARVFVDGKDTRKTTPIGQHGKIALHPGTHVVTFVVDDKKFNFDVDIKTGEDVKLKKTLEP